jgi:hypothetical protein
MSVSPLVNLYTHDVGAGPSSYPDVLSLEAAPGSPATALVGS